MVAGLIIGQKTQIEESTIQDFKNSNLSHMLAISGAHVSYLILGLSFVLQHSKVSKKFSKLAMMCFLVFFMALVGFTPSVTRACIMAILTILASLCYKKANVYQNLAMASFIILSFNPYTLLDIGFQLSFGGTIGIIAFYNPISKWVEEKIKQIQKSKKLKMVISVFKENRLENLKNKEKASILLKRLLLKLLTYVKQTILVTISANIIIFPIMIYHFNTLSTIFILSNLLASPILGVAIILSLAVVLTSFLIFPIAQIIAYILTPILQILMQIASITGNIPFANILVPTPSILSIVLYYFILLFLKLKPIWFPKKIVANSKKLQIYSKKQAKLAKCKTRLKNNSKRVLVFLVFIIYLSKTMLQLIPLNSLKIFFIDVGQGDSMLIQTPNHKNILIDGGGSEMGNFDVGKQVLLPYLLDKKITKIDYMLFTHFDNDHCARLDDCFRELAGKESTDYQTRKTIR